MKTKAITIGDERVCTKCGGRKPLTIFPFVDGRKRTYRGGQCRPCANKQTRSRPWAESKVVELVAKKKAIVQERKEQPCMDCGLAYPPYVMDFDHVRGVKKAGITHLVAQTWSVETLLEELAKCDLVCANCHRIRTHGDGGAKHRKRIMAGRAAAGL